MYMEKPSYFQPLGEWYLIPVPYKRLWWGQSWLNNCKRRRIGKLDRHCRHWTSFEPDAQCTYTGCVWEPSLVMTPSLSISICLNVLTFCRISSSVYLNDKHEGTKVRRSSHALEKWDKDKIIMMINLFKVEGVSLCVWVFSINYWLCKKRMGFQFQKGGHCRSTKNLYTIIWPAGSAKLGCKNTKTAFFKGLKFWNGLNCS